MKKTAKKSNWHRRSFRFVAKGLFGRANLERDLIFILIAVLFLVWLANIDKSKNEKKSFEELPSEFILPILNEGEIENFLNTNEPEVENDSWKEIDTTDWLTYKNNWYGFSLKYPATWSTPASQAAPSGSTWQYRWQFRQPASEVGGDSFVGFDVLVYSITKAKDFSATDEFVYKDLGQVRSESSCQQLEKYLIESEDWEMHQVYVSPTDDCYETTFFFSLNRDEYVYNLVPVFLNQEDSSDDRKLIEQNSPQFLATAATFNLTEIVRPKVPVKPKITAPKPVSYRIDSQGRMVCAKKNDKPSKSKKDKGKHLDMECCLDPDEYPNPWCYYPVDKYGKYLK